MSVDPDVFQDLFRNIMSNFASSVTVVTSYAEGRHHGLAVSAFTSVSLDPPLILICIDHASHSIEALRTAPGFTVNMLCADAAETAGLFASRHPDKFAALTVRSPEYHGAGLVLPSHSYASLEARTVESLEAGDHTIFIGHVEHAAYHRDDEPLLYWQRDFRRIRTD